MQPCRLRRPVGRLPCRPAHRPGGAASRACSHHHVHESRRALRTPHPMAVRRVPRVQKVSSRWPLTSGPAGELHADVCAWGPREAYYHSVRFVSVEGAVSGGRELARSLVGSSSWRRAQMALIGRRRSIADPWIDRPPQFIATCCAALAVGFKRFAEYVTHIDRNKCRAFTSIFWSPNYAAKC